MGKALPFKYRLKHFHCQTFGTQANAPPFMYAQRKISSILLAGFAPSAQSPSLRRGPVKPMLSTRPVLGYVEAANDGGSGTALVMELWEIVWVPVPEI
jgi:hypothetical protein